MFNRVGVEVRWSENMKHGLFGMPKSGQRFSLESNALTWFMSWAYGEAKEASGGWCARRLVIECASEPVAICQVLDKKLMGIRVVSRINRGPLLVE